MFSGMIDNTPYIKDLQQFTYDATHWSVPTKLEEIPVL